MNSVVPGGYISQDIGENIIVEDVETNIRLININTATRGRA